MSIQLFIRLPPAISTGMFYSWMIVASVYRYLFSTIWGVFVFSLLFWWLAPVLFDVEPFTGSELLGFISVMPNDYRIAALSSVVTVLGFLVAFHVATLNWRQQMNAQLKLATANEIEQFFAEAASLVTKAGIFAESVVETVDIIQKQPITDETEFKVRYVLEQSQQFFAVRNRLSEQSVEVHRIVGKHYSLLSTAWGAIAGLQGVVKAFSEITATMWFHVPLVLRDEPDVVGRFLSQVKVEEYMRFIRCCDGHYDYINAITGGLRGQLVSQVVGFNLSSLLHLFSVKGEFRKALDSLHQKQGTSG